MQIVLGNVEVKYEVRVSNFLRFLGNSLTFVKCKAYTRFGKVSYPTGDSWRVQMQASTKFRVVVTASMMLVLPCACLIQRAAAQQKNDFTGWFAAQPGPDQNRTSHGEWAGMKSYLGAGYARYDLGKSYLTWPLSP